MMTASNNEPPAAVAEGSDKRGTHLIGNIISALFLTLIVAIVAAVVVVPRIMGAVPLTVLTGSMQPTYRPGDMVVVQPVPISQLVVGDVITFQPISGNPRLNTHRIVEIITDNGKVTELVTRGDANNSDDPPILPEQIQGRVRYSVPFIGHFANPRMAILSITALVGATFLFYALKNLIAHRNSQQARR
jgi:signal peptidase